VVLVVVVVAVVRGQELPSAFMLLVKLLVFISIQSIMISATVMILIIMNGSFGRKIVVPNSADGLKNFD